MYWVSFKRLEKDPEAVAKDMPKVVLSAIEEYLL